ncbi:WXG100 family type VII secretion target, partial [Salinispora vitiensis]|uniref:WXG100 family type VII secretion target n=1 Tax=Salinispora vitiensis TaxID=999544 RepID=UPI0005353AB2
MTEQYYEWRPTPLHHRHGSDRNDDYVDNPTADYTPTPWDAVDIEQMRTLVHGESDERTLALAEAWRRTSTLLQATRENLKRHADGLAARWHSPAGQYFMSRVGAALYSLDEWTEVAERHARGLEQVGYTITKTRREMDELWQTYLAEQDRQYQIREADKGIQAGDLFGLNNGKTYEQVTKEFHERAKNIVKPLAELYVDVAHTNIQRGGRYKGPKELHGTFDGQLSPPMLPNTSIGTGPSGATVPGDRPELLPRPDATTPSP